MHRPDADRFDRVANQPEKMVRIQRGDSHQYES